MPIYIEINLTIYLSKGLVHFIHFIHLQNDDLFRHFPFR